MRGTGKRRVTVLVAACKHCITSHHGLFCSDLKFIVKQSGTLAGGTRGGDPMQLFFQIVGGPKIFNLKKTAKLCVQYVKTFF